MAREAQGGRQSLLNSILNIASGSTPARAFGYSCRYPTYGLRTAAAVCLDRPVWSTGLSRPLRKEKR